MGVKVREKRKGSGEWWIFINHQGRRIARRVGTQRAAQEAAREIGARLVLGGSLREKEKKAVPTLADYYESYQRSYMETALKPSTRDNYEISFRVHILPRPLLRRSQKRE